MNGSSGRMRAAAHQRRTPLRLGIICIHAGRDVGSHLDSEAPRRGFCDSAELASCILSCFAGEANGACVRASIHPSPIPSGGMSLGAGHSFIGRAGATGRPATVCGSAGAGRLGTSLRHTPRAPDRVRRFRCPLSIPRRVFNSDIPSSFCSYLGIRGKDTITRRGLKLETQRASAASAGPGGPPSPR